MGDGFADQLGEAMGGARVLTDPDLMEPYRHDRTTWVTPGHPRAVAFAETTAQVSAAVKVAAANGVPVVPRGAGSSLCAGSSAMDGSLILSLERMDRVLEILPDDQQAVVEPGVLNADLSVATAEHGLFYPPDPASKAFCSIGGNIATNAGGLCCVKYGVTRDYVLGLEVVLADGTVFETGRRTIKGVAGLDLTQLLIGSEGTLGIVTRARVRLRPAPEAAATMAAFFGDLGAAGRAVAAITRSGLTPSLLEIMDQRTVCLVDDWKRMGLDRDCAAMLLAQSDAPGAQRAEEIARIGELCEQAGATYLAVTHDPDEAEALLQARRLAGPAIEQRGIAVWEDIGVPRSKLPELIDAVQAAAARRGADVYVFGHAGDGNLHPTFLVPHGDDDAMARTLEAFDDIIDVALELGGTCTGEHGVGRLKARHLEREVGPVAVGVMRSIKRALDPQGILNPGRWL
ncbi:MAG TPA: FAD-linked oxidase C-terminal domain-containing protein [Egicoccus sp.]|nr:FAD-linked oxidase C-terminal domain-containing protein [Egicoccus sp.]HSK24687.1 FAD-linked oxidase C-terminal domain-containing protein [Egicoccus sp.]